MNHAGAGKISLRKEFGHGTQINRSGGVDVGVPGDAGAGRASHVWWLDILLVILVARQLLEEEVVEAVLGDQALDGDDVGLDTLDQGEDRGCHAETVLQTGVDFETGEVEVEGDTLLWHDDVLVDDSDTLSDTEDMVPD